MKKFIALLVFVFVAYTAIHAQTDTMPVIKFEQTEHNFGKIKEGTLANHSFVFYNTGKGPLVLTSVTASCGCTTPEWPKEPIMPGAKGVIKASFNSYGRPGEFTKFVTVKSNAGGEVSLMIKGEVTVIPVNPVSPVLNPYKE